MHSDRRWDADYVTVSKLIKDGTLGRVVDFETHFDRHRPSVPEGTTSWKYQIIPAGGAVYDLGTHLLDQALNLFGIPAKVTGFIFAQRAKSIPGFHDSFTVLLHYPDSLIVTAKCSVISPDENQLRFWVRGEKGSYKKVSD
jgi:predicted dehydrogenase